LIELPQKEAQAENGKAKAPISKMPEAKQYEGKILKDKKTGKRYKAENGKWTLIQD